MLLKRLIAISVFAALAILPLCSLRAQWVQTNGPFGAAINAFGQPCVTAGSSVFLGTGSGVFLSEDSGNSWKSAGLKGLSVYALHSMGPLLLASASDTSSLFLTTNRGLSWEKRDIGTSRGLPVGSFATIGTTLLCATGGAIYRSTDSGAHWTQLKPPQNFGAISQIAASETKLFVSTNIGVFRSIDTGNNWILVDNIWPVATLGSVLIGVAYEDGSGDSIFHSTDLGQTWSPVGTISTNIRSIVVIGDSLFAGGGGGNKDEGLYMSPDSGAHWSRQTRYKYDNLIPLVVIGSRLLFCWGDWPGSGPYRVSDSAILLCDSGVTNASIQTITASGPILFANDFQSTDRGNTWIPSKVHGVTASTFFHSKLFVLATGGTYLSSDSGLNWLQVGDYSGRDIGGNVFTGGFVLKDSSLFFTAGRVFVWNDSSLKWTTIDSLHDFDQFARCENAFFASDLHLVYRSSDNGFTWQQASSGLPDTAWFAGLVGLDTVLLLLDRGGLFRSTDNGATWNEVLGASYDAHLLVTGLKAFMVIPGEGVLVSINYGASWSSVDEGLGLLSSSGACLASDSTFLFLGTGDYYGWSGTSVWRRPLSDMIGSAAVAEPTIVKHDLRTYPNPFSQSTTISFTPEASGYADVSVVNLLGVEIARVFSGELAAGERAFVWNPAGLPDGMYECLVRMNGRIEKLPILLMR